MSICAHPTSDVKMMMMIIKPKIHVFFYFQATKMWYRSSPAELYYKLAENGGGVQQTQKLERICDTFFKKLIERGRMARPEVDELPPLKPPKAKMCKHRCELDKVVFK